MAVELKPIPAVFDIAILLLGKTLPGRKLNEPQFPDISVRYFNL